MADRGPAGIDPEGSAPALRAERLRQDPLAQLELRQLRRVLGEAGCRSLDRSLVALENRRLPRVARVQQPPGGHPTSGATVEGDVPAGRAVRLEDRPQLDVQRDLPRRARADRVEVARRFEHVVVAALGVVRTLQGQALLGQLPACPVAELSRRIHRQRLAHEVEEQPPVAAEGTFAVAVAQRKARAEPRGRCDRMVDRLERHAQLVGIGIAVAGRGRRPGRRGEQRHRSEQRDREQG